MEVEKKRSKGSFFHLFDWHGKSRKKLFANSNEPQDESKEGKGSVGNAAKFQTHMSEVDETVAATINKKECSDKGSCEFNYASSMDSDEGVGTKAPGVVARLMGLESLPTSNTQELQQSSTFSLPHSHRGSQYERVTPNSWNEYYPTEYLDISSKLESFSGNLAVSRTSKVQNRPIERFQIETLPPKSAKSIPGTHHKLLSPIRSPGFVLTKNAAYIMEAAARMIEPSPPTAYKGKESSIGSSSVPLRIQKLKERLEAAHRASNPNISNHPGSTKHSRGQHTDKNKSVAEGTRTANASGLSEKRNLGNVRNKVKSSSLAVQAKANVHNRETSTSSSTRSSVKKKERSDAKVNQSSRSSPDRMRTVHKETSTNKTTAVLRHNNQKQNCQDNATSRTSAPNQQVRKIKSTGVTGANRKMKKAVLNSETGSKRADAVTGRTEREASSSRLKKLSGNKLSANGDLEERVGDNISIKRGDKSIKCNVAFDGDIDRVSDNLNKDMDVISFTFSSPIMRKMPDPQSSGISSFDNNDQTYSKRLTFDSHGFDAIRSDTLNALLEQKIRELTCKVESSQCSAILEETSCSTLPDQSPLVNEVATSSAEQHRILSNTLDNYCSDSFDGPDWYTGNEGLNLSQNCQVTESEVTEEHSTSVNNDSVYDYDCAHSSAASITDPCFSNGSFSDNRNTSNGGKQFSSQEQEPFSWLPTNETQTSENETQLCDTASSFIGTFNSIDVKESSSNWELVYVRVILNGADLMLKELALGQTEKIITPGLFNQLENTEYETNGNEDDEYSKLGRKALFDCVSECLESWFGHVSVGSCESWAKCSTLIKRKGWLAEESYKEILSWKSMKDSMEDELVDKDMSSRHGKWLDFDKEAHEEGVVIGDEILTSLVEDLVSDLFSPLV